MQGKKKGNQKKKKSAAQRKSNAKKNSQGSSGDLTMKVINLVTHLVTHSLMEILDRMSAKLFDFLTPYPLLSSFGSDIFAMKSSQPPLLCPLFHDPLPSPMQTSYLEAPLINNIRYYNF